MKVVELKAQLAEAGLPVTGKKDELIERLLEHSKTLSPSAAKAAPAVAPAIGKPQSTPVMAPQPAVPAAPEQDDEIARRAARAARFGIPLDEETRRLQRMDRFGTADSSIATTLEAKISKALPDGKGKKHHGPPSHPHGNKKGGGVGGLEIDVEKLRERQARFGVVESKTLAQAEMDEAKARRLARFGSGSS